MTASLDSNETPSTSNASTAGEIRVGNGCGSVGEKGREGEGEGVFGWQFFGTLMRAGGPQRMTKAIDAFSLGCLLHYLLTGGRHPFGGDYERDRNIINNCFDLRDLNHLPEMHHLVYCMVQQVRSQSLQFA